MPLKTPSLYDGQLPVAKTVLYVVPAGKSAIIKTIYVCNVSAGTHEFILYFKASGGTSRKLVHFSYLPLYSMVEKGPITMDAGDSIEGQSSDGATLFDCVISGTEEIITEPAS